MKAIGKIYTDFPEKFGIPRQSGLVKQLEGRIILDPPYNVKETFDGIEEYSYLWILWQFSECIKSDFSPTVRPPKLGGEKRKGVFATRSPFRPNNIGLSCVKLENVTHTKEYGTVLTVSGIDMKNGTPIYDIKPYIAYADCKPDAKSSFADIHKNNELNNFVLPVVVTEGFLQELFDSIFADPKMEVEVNLPEQTITNKATGKSEHFEINAYKKLCLMNGLDDIDFLLSNKNKIEEWENKASK